MITNTISANTAVGRAKSTANRTISMKTLASGSKTGQREKNIRIHFVLVLDLAKRKPEPPPTAGEFFIKITEVL